MDKSLKNINSLVILDGTIESSALYDFFVTQYKLFLSCRIIFIGNKPSSYVLPQKAYNLFFDQIPEPVGGYDRLSSSSQLKYAHRIFDLLALKGFVNDNEQYITFFQNCRLHFLLNIFRTIPKNKIITYLSELSWEHTNDRVAYLQLGAAFRGLLLKQTAKPSVPGILKDQREENMIANSDVLICRLHEYKAFIEMAYNGIARCEIHTWDYLKEKTSKKEAIDASKNIRSDIAVASQEKVILFHINEPSTEILVTFFKAVKNLLSKSSAKIIITGSLPAIDLSELQAGNLWSKVLFAGNLDTKRFGALLSIADLIVSLPLKKLPNKLIETVIVNKVNIVTTPYAVPIQFAHYAFVRYISYKIKNGALYIDRNALKRQIESSLNLSIAEKQFSNKGGTEYIQSNGESPSLEKILLRALKKNA